MRASGPLPGVPLPPPPPPPLDDDDMMEDKRLFLRTITAFRQYEVQARTAMIVRRQNFQKLPPTFQTILRSAKISVEDLFSKYDEGIQRNQRFLDALCDAGGELFESYWPDADPSSIELDEPTPLDYDKVFSTLRQFVRDWSAEGRAEREVAYAPFRQCLARAYPNREARSGVKILVPGAGLCRLSVELALMGFTCQANEFSYHMLLAGHFAQNHFECREQFITEPFVDMTCNMINREDQFAECRIPDLHTAQEADDLHRQGLRFGDLSMVAGDFTEVYRKPAQREQWHAVASCFFLDTAHNILEYLLIIFDLLRPGGLLINVGPLLYHFAEQAASAAGGSNSSSSGGGASVDGIVSVELSLGEVVAAACAIGFELVEGPLFADTTYTSNVRSMKQLVYRTAFFVLQKPLRPGGGGGGGN